MSDIPKKARSIAKRAFNRSVTSLQNAIDNNELIETIEGRYAVFRSAWNEVLSKNDEYLAKLSDSDCETDNWLDDLCRTHDDLEVRADRAIKAVKTRSEQAVTETEQIRQAEQIKFLRLVRDKEKKRFDELIAQVKQHQENSEKSNVDEHAQVLSRVIEKLRTQKNKCESANKDYIDNLDSFEAKRAELEWDAQLENEFSDIEYLVCEITHMSDTEKHSNKNAKTSSVKLEKISIEKFDGNIRRYPVSEKSF